MNQSIETLNSPEFINLQPLDLNPLMSECQIKVLYVGQNRNGSFISKETATEMAKTLRGCPIVGYYKKDKEDYADHGHRITLDGGDVTFECMTVPYGFVSPTANTWFQTFDDVDQFGNSVEHEYLMTTGYLWTGQFEEAKLALEGRPQSMELDESTLDGKWSYDSKTQMDFFIINDATFSKLCILGEDVEPCFEGAAISQFSLNDEAFKNTLSTLYTMMKDLEKALQGGQNVNSENKDVQEYEIIEQDDVQEVVEEQEEEVIDNPAEDVDFAKKEEEEKKPEEGDDSKDSEKDAEEDDEKKKEKDKFSKEEENKADKDTEDKKKKEEDEEDYACGESDKKKKYELLEEENVSLKAQCEALEAECAELREFKNSIERKDKEALIEQFTALSDEDKADVVNNIDKYTLQEIKKELASICFDKGVNFAKADVVEEEHEEVQNQQEQIITYSLNGSEDIEDIPEEVMALRRAREELKNK